MHEAPGGLIRTLGVAVEKMVDAKVEEHETRMHPRRIRPRRTERITVEPFADDRVDDATLARAVELMQKQHYTEAEAALELDVPFFLFQREVREYIRMLRISLHERLVA